MKKLFLMVAAVGMLFTACNKECGHNFIEVDYSQKLAGTWTCIDAENEYAEALIFNADGSVTSTGVFEGGYYEKKGTYKIEGNKMTLSFEDGDYMESRFEMVEGEVFSLVDDELDVHFNYYYYYYYYYCENDLSDEIIGMWVVANGGPDMIIETFKEDGTAIFTGIVGEQTNLNSVVDYKVVGDLMFYTITVENEQVIHTPYRLIYSPDATSYGDLMTWQLNDDFSFTRLRVKQNINLNGKTYDYSSAYVSSAKGKDEDFNITGNTFNMAKVEARDFDVMFRSVLFALELNANTIEQNFIVNGTDVEFDIPIAVNGNKVTLDLSAGNPAYRDVDMYMFQDKDDTHLHIYMSTSSFINYFANLEIVTMLSEGKIAPTDTAAIEKVYANMDERVESINVSLVLKARE